MLNAQALGGLLKAVTRLRALRGAFKSREADGGKVEQQKPNQSKIMGYMQDTDRWLDAQLDALSKDAIAYDEFKRNIRERILESYRNGLKASGQSPAPRESRTPRRFRQPAKA